MFTWVIVQYFNVLMIYNLFCVTNMEKSKKKNQKEGKNRSQHCIQSNVV